MKVIQLAINKNSGEHQNEKNNRIPCNYWS